MSNWDTIYKHFQQGGEAWATLGEGIDPRFCSLLKNSHFPLKKALDIGCGTGKYLTFLETKGFVVDGIDSSPTAVEMTKKVAAKAAQIQQADMYAFSYPPDKYDLILSVSTLHHGRKAQVAHAVQMIYQSLVLEGRIFITLPIFDPSRSKDIFKEYTELEAGTYAPNNGPEAGLAHSFFTKQEVEHLFADFEAVSLDLDNIGRWFITAQK